MSAATEYAELLKLIEITGPFLSLPIFKEVFPQGLVKDDTAATALLDSRRERILLGDRGSLLLGKPYPNGTVDQFDVCVCWDLDDRPQSPAAPANNVDAPQSPTLCLLTSRQVNRCGNAERSI